ncbi:MAG TPA: hypothetical protein VIT23_16090 [Terrimicrobiaceae bacterium]
MNQYLLTFDGTFKRAMIDPNSKHIPCKLYEMNDRHALLFEDIEHKQLEDFLQFGNCDILKILDDLAVRQIRGDIGITSTREDVINDVRARIKKVTDKMPGEAISINGDYCVPVSEKNFRKFQKHSRSVKSFKDVQGIFDTAAAHSVADWIDQNRKNCLDDVIQWLQEFPEDSLVLADDRELTGLWYPTLILSKKVDFLSSIKSSKPMNCAVRPKELPDGTVIFVSCKFV